MAIGYSVASFRRAIATQLAIPMLQLAMVTSSSQLVTPYGTATWSDLCEGALEKVFAMSLDLF